MPAMMKQTQTMVGLLGEEVHAQAEQEGVLRRHEPEKAHPCVKHLTLELDSEEFDGFGARLHGGLHRRNRPQRDGRPCIDDSAD